MSQHAKPWTLLSFNEDVRAGLPGPYPAVHRKYVASLFGSYAHTTVTEPPVPVESRDEHMVGDRWFRAADKQEHVFDGDDWMPITW